MLPKTDRSDKTFVTKKGKFKRNRSSLSVLLIYNTVTILCLLLFYPILPIIMNYSADLNEYMSRYSVSYLLQYIIILTPALIAGSVFLRKALKGIDGWEELLKEESNENREKLKVVRKKCINLPYLIYIVQIFFLVAPLIVIFGIITLINGTPIIIVVKVVIAVFSLFSLAAIISMIYSKRVFTKILLKTYKGETHEGFKIGIKNKIFLQIIPMFIVSILFTSLIGYSRLVDDKGDSLFSYHKAQLMEKFINTKKIENIEQIKRILSKIELDSSTMSFIIDPKGKIKTSDGSKLSNYYIVSIKDFADKNNGRVYDEIGLTNLSIIKINGDDGEWIIGLKYEIMNNDAIFFFLINFFALLLINIFVLYYLSKSISGEISLVAKSLTDIAEGESVDLDKKLAVTSNDEIGDLVIAFNKIQDREKEHILEIEEKQSILMEQERLASLGHLMGGIAHNLRSPIMSISGGIEGLRDLIKEYDEGIDDEEVNKADHHEIAKEMGIWIEKLKPYCSYMDDIITTVKGQTTHYEDRLGLGFTLDEVGKRVEILIEHELKRYHCKLKVDFAANKNTKINGEISVLIQILNNLIVNSAHSYLGNGGEIELTVLENEKGIEFIVKDYGCGMNETVKKKLFKEMVTTKGNKGTGLGLYMSYSNLKARFGGRMRFESEEGKGTKFFINIPLGNKNL